MSAGVSAEYFDGRSAAAHVVIVTRENDALRLAGGGVNRLVPLRDLQWPERTRHGPRIAYLKSGGSLQCADSAAWDALARECGRHDSAVVRAQRSWSWVIGAVVAMVVIVWALFEWGVPWAARAALAVVPPSVDQSIGEAALNQIDERLMQPSVLPRAQREPIAAAFAKAVAALPRGSEPAYTLVFRKSKVGPNAFALPGGTMVLTDELVTLVKGDTDVIVGVLAHELGHVRHRHGMRMLVQASAIGVLASVIVGDFNSLLAAVPVMLGQASYSRAAEREADAESVRVMRAAGISPAAMVRFFEAVTAYRETRDAGQAGDAASAPKAPRASGDSWLGIAIASHPADAERVQFFKDAAARP